MSKPVCLPRLLVCTGKHCRKDKGFAKLVSMASERAGSLEAPCQGVCHGPVVAVQQGDDVRWFEKVSSKSLRQRVAKMSTSGHAAKDLRKHEVTKRHNIVRGERRMKPLPG